MKQLAYIIECVHILCKHTEPRFRSLFAVTNKSIIDKFRGNVCSLPLFSLPFILPRRLSRSWPTVRVCPLPFFHSCSIFQYRKSMTTSIMEILTALFALPVPPRLREAKQKTGKAQSTKQAKQAERRRAENVWCQTANSLQTDTTSDEDACRNRSTRRYHFTGWSAC